MSKIRQPAVAGQFYPGNTTQLRKMVTEFLETAVSTDLVPKAIIAPHAGYIYSGPIAATAYAHITRIGPSIKRVILLGPAHRVAVNGLAVSSADGFSTPLGTVPVDKDARELILQLPQVQMRDDVHALEHSLEVHLPFLQAVCDEFSIVPLAIGSATMTEVSEVIKLLWGGAETLIVISSDLSHYYDYETACRMDRAVSTAIENLQPEEIDREQACGRIAIQGLLRVAKEEGLKAHTVDLRNSGDTAGSRDRVVGYGAYIFTN